MDPVQPRLIVVTGRPGSGKTTLVHPLARAIRCPAICRDEIKEGLVNAHRGRDDSALAALAYGAFRKTLEGLLGAGVTTVAEAAFQDRLWMPILQTLRPLASLRVVVLAIDAEAARARQTVRAVSDPMRARYHDPHFADATYEPPRVDAPLLTVDTTEGYRPSFERIVEFALGPD